MSKSQVVIYRDEHLWAYDVSLAILLKHMIDVAGLELAPESPDWLPVALDDWRRLAHINDFAFTIEDSWPIDQIGTFAAVVGRAAYRIGERAFIPAGEVETWSLLDGMQLETRGELAVPTAPILVLADAVVALVAGTLPAAVAGTDRFFGFGPKLDDATGSGPPPRPD